METSFAELAEQVKRDEVELERLASEWRNYKAGWINGALMGLLFGAAIVFLLFALA